MEVRPQTLLNQAQERFALQDYFGCIHLLEDVIERGEGYADAHQLHGLALHMVGEPLRALEAFDQALVINPNYHEAHIHRGLVLNELGRSREAEAAFVAARESRGEPREGLPAHHAAKLANQHAALGDAYAEAGGIVAAIDQYRQAMRLGPAFHDLRYRLARLLLDAGRAGEARLELEKIVEARPQFVEAQATYGMACFMGGDEARADEIWSALERQHPDDIRVRAYRAMLKRKSHEGDRVE